MARGLNPQQAEAVAATRGPVCILAGAGSGKTTTITRRIANQVLTGAFAPSEILAVTFTNKAAAEMVSRLARSSVTQVRTKTFHAEALAQYRRSSDEPKDLVASKGAILASLVQSLPMPYRFTSVRDVATEIEWAKNKRLKPGSYASGIGDHEPPIPLDLMSGVFASYERRKAAAKQIDFEDLLEQTIVLLESNIAATMEIRERYRAFTVDEYQDVNLLQQTLLDIWVGDRDDICVVGDDHQSIFGFTGATADHLLRFPERYRSAKVITLTTNYRSTPEVLAIANLLVPRLGGTPKRLESAGGGGSGVSPTIATHATAGDEVSAIVSKAGELRRAGVAWEEMAVLYRINGRSEDLELELAKARIPFQVKDSPFMRRPAARAVISKLKRMSNLPVAKTVHEITDSLGYREDGSFTGDEATRQADMARLRALATGTTGDIASFLKDLEGRFASEDSTKGIQILTYHRAKGLEFTAVFMPRCEDKEIPFALSKSDDDIAEERRLFYVGITRAKRYLQLSWCRTREGERRKMQTPSPFLMEIGLAPEPGTSSRRTEAGNGKSRTSVAVGAADEPLFHALRSWRLEKSRELSVPAYVIFHDATLAAIASDRPSTVAALAQIQGVGPSKCERFGADIIRVVLGNG